MYALKSQLSEPVFLVLVFSIVENLTQNGTVNFKDYAFMTDQRVGEQLRIWTISGPILNDSV